MAVMTAGSAFAAVPSAYCQAYGMTPPPSGTSWVMPALPVVTITYTTKDAPPETPTDSTLMLDTITFSAWPTAGQYKFQSYYDELFCLLEPLSGPTGLLKDLGPFVGLLKGSVADVNGPLIPECKTLLALPNLDGVTSDPSAPIPTPCYCSKWGTPQVACAYTLPIVANGMTDGVYELSILQNILNDTGNPRNAEVLAQYKANVAALATLIDGALIASGYLDVLGMVQGADRLPALLAHELGGLATLDDDDTNAALNELLGMLEDLGLTPPPGGVASICAGFDDLGKYGDFNGDGYSNFDTYNFYKNTPGFDKNVYAAKATGNAISVTGPGSVKIDGSATISATVSAMIQSPTYAWKKNGTVIPDESGSSLILEAIQDTDEADYICSVTHTTPGKAVVTVDSAPWHLNVAAAMPVAGGLGLALLAGVCALGGAMGLRRK